MARQPTTSIYRRVSCRIWADERFRKLSGPKANAQTLWFHLLFGEQTGIVPGLFRVGEAAFAEQLGWGIGAFRKAFLEVAGQGMVKADWSSRLVWVPKAIQYNPPASPNVVRHWGTEWHLLPECAMRSEAEGLLKGFLQDLGEGFANAFTEVLSGVFTKDYVQSGAVAVTETRSSPKPPPGASSLRVSKKPGPTALPKSPEQQDAEDRAAVEAAMDRTHG